MEIIECTVMRKSFEQRSNIQAQTLSLSLSLPLPPSLNLTYPQHGNAFLECYAERRTEVLNGFEGILLRDYLQLVLEPDKPHHITSQGTDTHEAFGELIIGYTDK